jgi:hypothetical protein
VNQGTHPALLSYPRQAVFGRNIPKNKIYEHSGANTRLKEFFVKQVEQISWQYKLAPETINLPAKNGVCEIQVFTIQLKTEQLNWDVLRCIDEVVKSPIIYELNFEDKVQVVAAYKHLNGNDSCQWVLSSYLSTEWLPNNTHRSLMPIALDLGGVYELILQRLIPLPVRQHESFSELLRRFELAAEKRKEINILSNKQNKEKQFNRKVAINHSLRQLKSELEGLMQ